MDDNRQVKYSSINVVPMPKNAKGKNTLKVKLNVQKKIFKDNGFYQADCSN